MIATPSRAVCAALALSLVFTSCYGPFEATKRLHSWNSEFEGEWEQEGVFVLLCIIPVYPLAAIGDALIFNSVEFWGGTNPMASSGIDVRLFQDGDRTIRLERSLGPEGPVLNCCVEQGGAVVATLKLESTAEGTSLRAGDGHVYATATTLDDGQIEVRNGAGEVLATGFAGL